jgi:hypothetical protein
MSDIQQPVEEKVPELADVMQEILGILQDHEERLAKVCAAHEDLDKEIHEDFFGPIHEAHQSSVRTKGIEDLKGRYGSMWDEDTQGALKGFGVDDIYSSLYDELEKIKGEEGYGPEREKSFIEDIHNQAMGRIAQIRGKPKESEKKAEEKPAGTAIAVEVKKEPSVKEKLSSGKRRSMIDGY